jgi:hypothetical protein
MLSIDYEALGRLAERWVLAEAERKLRRHERAMAFAILMRDLECPQDVNPETGQAVATPETDEQREMHDHAIRAGRAYDDAYPKARAGRAAMTRMVMRTNRQPAPDTGLRAACDKANGITTP